MGVIVGTFSVAANLVSILALLKARIKKAESIEPYIQAATETAISYANAVIEAESDATPFSLFSGRNLV